LTVIAALRNVMSYAGEDDAGTAGHNSSVPNGWRDSHENASVPFSRSFRASAEGCSPVRPLFAPFSPVGSSIPFARKRA
jgi:hypothetical protein